NTTEDVIAGITACVEALKRNLPDSKILVLGIFPRGAADDPKRAQIADINKAVANLQDEKRVWLLDFGGRFLDEDGQIPETLMPDLLHPNREGYEIMAAEIKPAVLRLLDAPAGAEVP